MHDDKSDVAPCLETLVCGVVSFGACGRTGSVDTTDGYLPQVYIAPLLKTLRRLTKIPRIFNLAAVLVMGTQNHTKFARRKRDESDKRNFLILPIIKDSIFLSEFSAGMVVRSEIL